MTRATFTTLCILVVAVAVQDAGAACTSTSNGKPCKLSDPAGSAGVCSFKECSECGWSNALLGCPCGGLKPRTCLPGLKCRLPTQCADCLGKCVCGARGGSGCPCGGFTANPKKCLPGFQCKYSGVPDLPGSCTCKTQGAGIGCHCGGNILNAPTCMKGLKCDMSPPMNPDVGGICVPV